MKARVGDMIKIKECAIIKYYDHFEYVTSSKKYKVINITPSIYKGFRTFFIDDKHCKTYTLDEDYTLCKGGIII